MMSDIHPVERPREKLARRGAGVLSDQELLALLLRTGYSGTDVLELSASLWRSYPDGPGKAGYQALARFKGMGESRAAAVVAAFELARRGVEKDQRPMLDSPARVLDQVPRGVKAGRKEHLLAFYLNARSQMVHHETVSIGTLSSSLVHPREVFAPALSCGAAALIVVHNHPSGDCSPSSEDKDATRRLSRAGELMGIPLLDHLIVSDAGFFSFKEHGLLS
jgi:DNA repair protein RadC